MWIFSRKRDDQVLKVELLRLIMSQGYLSAENTIEHAEKLFNFVKGNK